MVPGWNNPLIPTIDPSTSVPGHAKYSSHFHPHPSPRCCESPGPWRNNQRPLRGLASEFRRGIWRGEKSHVTLPETKLTSVWGWKISGAFELAVSFITVNVSPHLQWMGVLFRDSTLEIFCGFTSPQCLVSNADLSGSQKPTPKKSCKIPKKTAPP